MSEMIEFWRIAKNDQFDRGPFTEYHVGLNVYQEILYHTHPEISSDCLGLEKGKRFVHGVDLCAVDNPYHLVLWFGFDNIYKFKDFDFAFWRGVVPKENVKKTKSGIQIAINPLDIKNLEKVDLKEFLNILNRE